MPYSDSPFTGATLSPTLSLDAARFERRVQELCALSIKEVMRLSSGYAWFHIGYAMAGALELLGLALLCSLFTKPWMLASLLALLFVTAFSYFVLRFYLEAKKPEQLLALRSRFMEACRKEIASSLQEKAAEYHLSLSHALFRFSSLLEGVDSRFYRVPKEWEGLTILLEKFSLWMHWGDLHQMRELLLFAAIQELLALVRSEPTDLEVHASLASAYQVLSRLYMDPRKRQLHLTPSWISKAFASESMRSKFERSAEKALEELKIVDSYAPLDPWVHMELASIYHDLEMSEEEITCYEKIVSLFPEDRESLFKLGVLYFKLGRNARGLEVYQRLARMSDQKAEQLIAHYDAQFFHHLDLC